MCASGLKLHERLTAVVESIERVEAKRGALPAELARLQKLVSKGLQKTAEMWPPIAQGYAWCIEQCVC